MSLKLSYFFRAYTGDFKLKNVISVILIAFAKYSPMRSNIGSSFLLTFGVMVGSSLGSVTLPNMQSMIGAIYYLAILHS